MKLIEDFEAAVRAHEMRGSLLTQEEKQEVDENFARTKIALRQKLLDRVNRRLAQVD